MHRLGVSACSDKDEPPGQEQELPYINYSAGWQSTAARTSETYSTEETMPKNVGNCVLNDIGSQAYSRKTFRGSGAERYKCTADPHMDLSLKN